MFFFFKQKTAYEMRISDWSSDVCSSDLRKAQAMRLPRPVIGVLPQDHDPHVPRRRRVERREPVARPRINRLALGTFAREELLERRHIGLLEQIGRASCRERVCQYV